MVVDRGKIAGMSTCGRTTSLVMETDPQARTSHQPLTPPPPSPPHSYPLHKRCIITSGIPRFLHHKSHTRVIRCSTSPSEHLSQYGIPPSLLLLWQPRLVNLPDLQVLAALMGSYQALRGWRVLIVTPPSRSQVPFPEQPMLIKFLIASSETRCICKMVRGTWQPLNYEQITWGRYENTWEICSPSYLSKWATANFECTGKSHTFNMIYMRWR